MSDCPPGCRVNFDMSFLCLEMLIIVVTNVGMECLSAIVSQLRLPVISLWIATKMFWFFPLNYLLSLILTETFASQHTYIWAVKISGGRQEVEKLALKCDSFSYDKHVSTALCFPSYCAFRLNC